MLVETDCEISVKHLHPIAQSCRLDIEKITNNGGLIVLLGYYSFDWMVLPIYVKGKSFSDQSPRSVQPCSLSMRRRHFGQNVWLHMATSDRLHHLAEISWKGEYLIQYMPSNTHTLCFVKVILSVYRWVVVYFIRSFMVATLALGQCDWGNVIAPGCQWSDPEENGYSLPNPNHTNYDTYA